jgi:mannose-1-phosphate guanylyltransferase
VQILSDLVFDFIPSFGASNILYDSLTLAMEKGHEVNIYDFECQWFETGNPHDFVAATTECFEILSGQGPSYAQSALALRLKNNNVSFDIQAVGSAKALAMKTARVDSKATLSGFVTVGAGSVVPASCELHNVIVGNQVQVPEGTKAHNTLIL